MNNSTFHLDPAELAALGEGRMAYVKPMSSEDIARLYPQAPQIEPGLQLFALLSASGSPSAGHAPRHWRTRRRGCP